MERLLFRVLLNEADRAATGRSALAEHRIGVYVGRRESKSFTFETFRTAMRKFACPAHLNHSEY
jgi:hypothetical protein